MLIVTWCRADIDLATMSTSGMLIAHEPPANRGCVTLRRAADARAVLAAAFAIRSP